MDALQMLKDKGMESIILDLRDNGGGIQSAQLIDGFPRKLQSLPTRSKAAGENGQLRGDHRLTD